MTPDEKTTTCTKEINDDNSAYATLDTVEQPPYKRRKFATDINITDLNDEAVRHIANYLPKTSRALLAVALTTESSDWKKVEWTKPTSQSILSFFGWKKMKREKIQPSPATKAIIFPHSSLQYNLWDEIDFGDIEPHLSCRLSDDDVAAVLSCVNAVQKVKTLVLTNLINITGEGLSPLRCSAVIQRLDMTLCIMECEPGRDQGRLNRRYKDPPSLAKAIVVPILDSIIDQDNNSLKYIQFPNNWRDPIDGLLDPFLIRYKQSDREIRCSCCENLCRETLSVNPGSRMENTHAAQDFTCYQCLGLFCYNCEEEEEEVPVLAACRGCEKEFCSSCVSMIPCGTCHENNYFGCFQASYYCSSECAKRFTCGECKRINCGNYMRGVLG